MQELSHMMDELLSENAKVGMHTEAGRDGAVEALVDLTIKF